MKLRPHQTRTVDLARAAYQQGKRAVLVVLPTGGGKTACAAWMIHAAVQRGKRTMFGAHRTELIDQTVRTLGRFGVTDVRVIQADRDDGRTDAPVIVGSIDTLTTDRWIAAMPLVDLLIIDEAHHSVCTSWKRVISAHPGTRLLGLTATPQRGDRRGLGDTYDALVVGATMRELIDAELLARPVVIAPKPLRPGQIAQTPLDAWRQFAGGQRAAIFRARVADALRDVDEFRAAGLRAEAVTAATRNRSEILASFAADELDALSSVGVLCEGWDDPACAFGIVARRPSHEAMWLQICGRVLRSHPGKTRGTIVDLFGAWHEHGLPEQERTYSLDGRGIGAAPRDQIRQCATCGVVSSAGPQACPACHAPYPVKRSKNRVVGAELSEVTEAVARSERVLTLRSRGWLHCYRCRKPIRPGATYGYAAVARRAWHVGCPMPTEGATP